MCKRFGCQCGHVKMVETLGDRAQWREDRSMRTPPWISAGSWLVPMNVSYKKSKAMPQIPLASSLTL
jgi:hypothetical protein